MTMYQAAPIAEDFSIAIIIARVFIESGKPYTFSNVISRCYSTAFTIARDRLESQGIAVDDNALGMEVADEMAHDFLAMTNTILRKHYAAR